MAPGDVVSATTALTVNLEALLAGIIAIATSWAGYAALRKQVSDLTDASKLAATERQLLDARLDAIDKAIAIEAARLDRLSGEWAAAMIVERVRFLELWREREKGRRERPSRRSTRPPGEDTIG